MKKKKDATEIKLVHTWVFGTFNYIKIINYTHEINSKKEIKFEFWNDNVKMIDLETNKDYCFSSFLV